MTQDEIIEMARQVGLCRTQSNFNDWIDAGPSGYELEEFAKLVAAKEREACAKVCDLAMLQNQETMNELDEKEHIAQCIIQGAMNQSVKLSESIRARGEA